MADNTQPIIVKKIDPISMPRPMVARMRPSSVKPRLYQSSLSTTAGNTLLKMPAAVQNVAVKIINCQTRRGWTM